MAGTTRDVVEVRLDLGGVACIVSDTAGLRAIVDSSESPLDQQDVVELEGMRRAREAVRQAQVRVFVGDASDSNSLRQAVGLFNISRGIVNEGTGYYSEASGESDYFSQLLSTAVNDPDSDRFEEETNFGADFGVPSGWKDMLIVNKADIACDNDGIVKSEDEALSVSCATGEGIENFELSLAAAALNLLQTETESSSCSSEGVLITRARHRSHIAQCCQHLERFMAGVGTTDLAAEELRLALLELGRVSGEVGVEEMLDRLFRDFCIGK
jgi:tRNA modification GTPase